MGLTRSPFAGYDVGVAVIDSGITPDGNISVYKAYDFTIGTLDSHKPDDYGHGSHVAGLIASTGAKAVDGTYRAVARGVRLIDLKVLDGQGQGHVSDVILALEFAVAMRDTLGIDVINLSLGHPVYEAAADDPLVQAVENAVRAGITVVVSAGNIGRNPVTREIGYGGITSPGNAPSAITVGSEDTKGTPSLNDDTAANYSSRGPAWYDGIVKPDLVAPGHKLVSEAAVNSTLYKTFIGSLIATDEHDAGMLSLSGTSMASAVASGVAALVIEANRQVALTTGHYKPLSPNAIKAILQFTAVPLSDPNGALYDILTQGAGAINANGATAMAAVMERRLPPVRPGCSSPSRRPRPSSSAPPPRPTTGRSASSGATA